MDSTQLTTEQAERLNRQAAAMLRYLNRLCDRMHRLHFPLDDPLRREATRARDAMQGLFVMTHYASCEHGVGRPEKG